MNSSQNQINENQKNQVMIPKDTLYAAFRKDKPPHFTEGPDLLAAEEWIDGLEMIFNFIDCPDERKAGFASYMLTGKGRKWWKSQFNTEFKYIKHILWVKFQENFFQQYFPSIIKEKKLRDFIHLKKESTSIMEYETVFTTLSDYTPHLVIDHREKVKRFEDGLRKDIQKQTNVIWIYDYSEPCQRVLIIEQNINEDRE